MGQTKPNDHVRVPPDFDPARPDRGRPDANSNALKQKTNRGDVVGKIILLCTASAISLACTQAAYAQSSAPVAAAGGAEVTEVVVTGSRIARRDFVATSPIVTQTQEALQQSGAVNIEKSLQQLPQFAGGQGEGSVNVGGGSGGRATLNLRSLGDVRGLVLLDGRRLPPSGVLGQVDVNIIPQSVIAGVETITGGASAVYGSDAMSGVVNFKTRTNFTGIQLRRAIRQHPRPRPPDTGTSR